MDQVERGRRILGAAEELLLAWGYRRVTIDEIARRAKVGKGTVYLHWKTKDALLLAVVLDAKLWGQRRQLQRMRADPLEILPSRLMSAAYRDFLGKPLLRALFTDDSDLLGRLTDIARKELAELTAYSNQALRRHLEVLRAHGLVRTDTDVADQHYALLAMSTGFFMAEALYLDRAPQTAEAQADILAHTVRSALETSACPGAGPGTTVDRVRAAATAAAPEILPLHERLVELSARELRRQLRT